MKRKYVYPLLVVIFTLGWYFFENYLHQAIDAPIIEEGKQPKATTNTYFLPTSTTGQVIHHEYYSLSYSEVDEQAEWVAYELKADHLVQSDFKRPYFEVDPKVRTKSAHWRNYKNSGYDRGHLCPAADREFSKEAYTETFLTSNISPQRHAFNAGIWNNLEQQVRYWARSYDGVFVVTGGVLNDKMGAIGSEQVTVPESFYKIVYDQSGGNVKMLAFLMNHTDTDRPLREFVTSVDHIEDLTGIDFFPELEDSVENKLEASTSLSGWKLR